MALKKFLLDLPLYGGVDTKSDDFTLSIGKLKELQNADLTKTGKIRKRTGYALLDNDKVESATNTIQSIHSVGTHNGQLLVLGEDGYDTPSNAYATKKAFVYSEEQEHWIEAGEYTPLAFSVNQISGSSVHYNFPTIAYGAGYKVFAYNYESTDDPEAVVTILDGYSDDVVQRRVVISDATEDEWFPQIDFLSQQGNKKRFSAWLLDQGASSSDLSRWSWDGDPSTAANASNRQQNLLDTESAENYDGLWDTCTYHKDGDIRQLVITMNAASNTINVDTFNTDNELIDTFAILTTTTVPVKSLTIHPVFNDAGEQRFFIFYQADASDDWALWTVVLEDDPATGLKVKYSESEVTTAPEDYVVGNVTVAKDEQFDVQHSGTNDSWIIAYEMYGDPYDDGYNTIVKVKVAEFDTTYKSDENNATTRWEGSWPGACLAAHAFTYDGKAYFPLMYHSTLQSTYYLGTMSVYTASANVSSSLVGTAKGVINGTVLRNIGGKPRYEVVDAGSGEYLKYRRGLSNTVQTSTSEFTFAGMKQTRLNSQGEVEYAVVGINIDMDPDPVPIIPFGPVTIIGGGVIKVFDSSLVQFGFLQYPEAYDAVTVATGGAGSVPTDTTHNYKMLYEWTDDAGQIYRSTPSSAIAVDIVGGSDDGTVTIGVRHPDFLTKERQPDPASPHDVRVRLFRAVGSVYYKLPIGDYPSKVAGYYQMIDTFADADITSKETLYTTGGVLDNVVPPASNIMAATNDRMWLVPMDDRKAAWYSKPKVNGVGLEFAGEFVMRIDDSGDITGLAALDDKMIIFKERSIYYVYGSGPNSLGQGSFSPPQKISSDVGAVNHNSIVLTPNGLMFMSNKGIYLLNRGLQVAYIGAPVEEYNDHAVKKATLVQDKNQVIFLLADGQPALVYDYYHNQWSTYYNHAGKDACIYDGKYTWVTSNNRIKKSDTDVYKDQNFLIDLKVKTGWIHPQSIQEWMRVYSFSLLGHYKSAHTLIVKVYMDYDETTVIQTFNFVTSTGQSGDEPLQFTGRLSRQKCQSIMFEIYDDTRSAPYESMELSGLTLEIAQKTGIYRQPVRKLL